ncbi:unnamed protein product [Colias eurytheme]|nr:unnamed protein product [Colias eurytheme]
MQSNYSAYKSNGPVLIKGSKKKYMLLYRSHTYSRCTISKKGVVWKCTASKSEGCKSVLTTDPNLNVVQSKENHNHAKPDIDAKPKHVYFSI